MNDDERSLEGCEPDGEGSVAGSDGAAAIARTAFLRSRRRSRRGLAEHVAVKTDARDGLAVPDEILVRLPAISFDDLSRRAPSVHGLLKETSAHLLGR